jgi:hypothetical protein
MRASFEESLLPKRRFFAGGPTSPHSQDTTAFMTVAFAIRMPLVARSDRRQLATRPSPDPGETVVAEAIARQQGSARMKGIVRPAVELLGSAPAPESLTREDRNMAIRKSVEESMVVAGPRDGWLARCQEALEAQGFTQIDASSTLFQIKANYKKAAVWGDLELTLLPERDDSTKITARATANVDNVFAVFGSPDRKIIDRFKQGIR